MINPEPVRENSHPGLCLPLKMALLYLGCGLLVTCYVNTFLLWAWLAGQLGSFSRYFPPLIVVASLLSVLGYLVPKYRSRGIDYCSLVAGLAVCLAALAIPDPAVPIKRIHVAEYLLLAFPVRYTLSHRLTGRELTLFTALVTALFGIHDELFQGLHPLRYYGLPDMGVNGLAGLGGSLLGHAVRLFHAPPAGGSSHSHGRYPDQEKNFRHRLPWLVAFLLAGILFLVVTLSWYKKSFIPWWTMLPLLGAVLAWQLSGVCRLSPLRFRHGLQAVCWLSLLLIFYPAVANVTPLVFN